jgi:FkbM family methyltransferase
MVTPVTAMTRALFQVYKVSPFWLRNSLSKMTGPLRVVMKPFNRVRMDGFDMFVDFRDNASLKYLARRGTYERAERDAFRACLRANPGSIALDIGAHYGIYTLTGAHALRSEVGGIAGSKRVFGFEPDPTPHACIGRSLSANGFGAIGEVVHAIVSDREGTERLFLNARSSADNRTHQVTSAGIDCRAEIAVQSLTIDGFLEKRGIGFDHPFVIKMDIQGNEPRALRGMRRLFEGARGFALFFEYCPYLMDSAGCSEAEFTELVSSLGADTFYEFVDGRFVELGSVAGLRAALARVRDGVETKMQGTAGDFLILRKMKLTIPAATPRGH